MARHFHAATPSGDETFTLRRHAAAAGTGVRGCDDPAHFIETRPCPECGQALGYVAQGQGYGLYRCPDGHAQRIQRLV